MVDFDGIDVLFRKAVEHQNRGHFVDAVALYNAAIRMAPDLAPAHFNRAAALHSMKRYDEAVEGYDQAITLKPHNASAHHNKGVSLREMSRLNEALCSCDRAIEINPNYAEAYSNRGLVLQEQMQLQDALCSFDRAIELKPGYADAYWNKSLCLLLMQRFDEGWQLYEWRKNGLTESKPFPTSSRSVWASEPEWLRQEVKGKTLLIHSEQGLGDTIQFCRYALLAEAAGATVVLSAQDSLARLLKKLSPTIRIVGSKATIPHFDHHISLLSMPLAFKTGLNNIPAIVPYLKAEPERRKKWNDKIGSSGFKVGICWQGDNRRTIDIGRSFSVKHFERLSKIPSVRLISLQKNVGTEQLLDLPAGMTVESLGGDFDAGPDAFVDSAAVITGLDLVITSDTAIAHLAGALGHATWLVLKYLPDWRWHLNRADSPWYPAMRLFRQPSRGDWASVFTEMEEQLVELIGSKKD